MVRGIVPPIAMMEIRFFHESMIDLIFSFSKYFRSFCFTFKFHLLFASFAYFTHRFNFIVRSDPQRVMKSITFCTPPSISFERYIWFWDLISRSGNIRKYIYRKNVILSIFGTFYENITSIQCWKRTMCSMFKKKQQCLKWDLWR